MDTKISSSVTRMSVVDTDFLHFHSQHGARAADRRDSRGAAAEEWSRTRSPSFEAARICDRAVQSAFAPDACRSVSRRCWADNRPDAFHLFAVVDSFISLYLKVWRLFLFFAAQMIVSVAWVK